MAITDGKQYDETPVGAGLTGRSKTFFIQLAAGVEKALNFGKYKLSDVENVQILWGTGTTGGAVALQGIPDTTDSVDADGEAMTLQDVAGGAYAVTIIGAWTYK